MASFAFPALTSAPLARRFWQPLFDDPAIRARFQPHAGRSACVTVMGTTLHYLVGDDGAIDIVAPENGAADPDLNLVVPFSALQSLLTRDEHWRSRIHQDIRDGDVPAAVSAASFADDFLDLWSGIPALLEYWATKALPTPLSEAAHRAGGALRETFSDLSERLSVQKRDAVARLLAGNDEFRAAAQQLQALAQRTAALETRLAKLENPSAAEPE